MAYKALYRKWRPLTFDDVIGQTHITKTLKNEIAENRIAHAYLFTGTRGTGKTSTAKILSRAVNCTNPNGSNPCNECEICRGILNETVMDIIEIDAASNTGVDNIRSIIEQVQYTPTVAKYKVYIIDEVHMLSQGAFNALLKTLEEPPKHVVFILATTEVHKIPATILSRCQRFDFKTISPSDIADRIKTILAGENVTAEDSAIEYVAYLANGSMRDSLSILDQCLAFKHDNLTYDDAVEILGGLDDASLTEIADFIGKNDAKGALCAFYKILETGKNIDDFAMRALDIFAKIMVCSVTGAPDKNGNAAQNEKILKVSENFSHEHIMFCINVLNELINNLKFTKNAKTLIEVAITRMSEPDLSTNADALLCRIKRLEEKIASFAAGNFPRSDAESNAEKGGSLPETANHTAAHTAENSPRPSDIPPWEDIPQNGTNLQDDEIKNSNGENFSPQTDADNTAAQTQPYNADNNAAEAEKSAENTAAQNVGANENSGETGKNPSEENENQNAPPQNAPSGGASLKKITLSWGEVINRSIKDGELTVYFALKDTAAQDDNGVLTIKVQDEEKRGKILTNREKIVEYIIKMFGTKVEIKAEVSGKTHIKEDTTARVFDKLDEFSKQFPQNFTSEKQ